MTGIWPDVAEHASASPTDVASEGSNANEEDEELDDDGYGGTYSSASPHDDYEVPPTSIIFDPLPHEMLVFDAVVQQIFQEYHVSAQEALPLNVSSIDWRLLDEEDLELPLQTVALSEYQASVTTRVRKALIQTFSLMRRSCVYDVERLLRDVRTYLEPVHRDVFNEREKRSTGAGLAQHQDIEYEGGDELPNDGISVVTRRWFTTPLD